MFSGNWTRRTSREKYIALARSRFDYKLTAERFNTTRASLNVFAARQDKRLEAVKGKPLRLIEQDRIKEGLDRFYAETGVFSTAEFNYRVSELLPKTSQKDSFLVSECGCTLGKFGAHFLCADTISKYRNYLWAFLRELPL